MRRVLPNQQDGAIVAKKPNKRPTIERREVIDGFVHAYDSEGRPCLDSTVSERVVLVQDLRAYGDKLHIGALGWTAPETTDCYKEVDVQFDSGGRLRLKTYAFDRVAVESEHEVVAGLLERYKNTRFDADPEIAAVCRSAWIAESYAPYLGLDATLIQGEGDQELYGFTFPSLKELAHLKGEHSYPVKLGYSQDPFEGALGRIRSQISEKAAYPERPEVLFVFRTWGGRKLEQQVHQRLRQLGRKIPTSLGKEWFTTSTSEVCEILSQCQLPSPSPHRAVGGSGETIEEAFSDLTANGGVIETGHIPGEAGVYLRIRDPGE